MKAKKYLAAVLCLCLLLCGCTTVQHTAVPSGTGAITGPSKTYKTDSEWNDLLSYEAYIELSAEERSAFCESFENTEDFSSWFKAVKRIYDSNVKENFVGNDGVIDMEQIAP